jgi:large subunit ribosomal protein L30
MTEVVNTEVVAEEVAVKKAPAKKTTKKAKAKQPLYINGRYVVEKQLAAKPKKGTKPYKLGKKQIKVTLVKSTNGCLEGQKKTIEALGLTKIRSSKVLCDNDAIRGMIFKVKHLVVVEEVK